MKLKIRKQWYPTHDGQRPLSFAIYLGRKFLGYSWTREGAEAAIQELQKLAK